jgi:hypothetical protein
MHNFKCLKPPQGDHYHLAEYGQGCRGVEVYKEQTDRQTDKFCSLYIQRLNLSIKIRHKKFLWERACVCITKKEKEGITSTKALLPEH